MILIVQTLSVVWLGGLNTKAYAGRRDSEVSMKRVDHGLFALMLRSLVYTTNELYALSLILTPITHIFAHWPLTGWSRLQLGMHADTATTACRNSQCKLNAEGSRLVLIGFCFRHVYRGI